MSETTQTVENAAPSIPKFFGIGWSKTGSNSLALAMRMLGFRSWHIGADAWLHPGTNYATRIYQASEKNANNPLACVADFVKNYDFLIDWPINKLWRQLGAHYPAAKFIVTYRNPHEVAFSGIRHNWREVQAKRERAFPETYAEFVALVTEHYTEIFEAAVRDPDRFLLLSLHDSDEFRWRALCTFTGTPLDKILSDGILPAWPKEYTHNDYAFIDTKQDAPTQD
jgi:hypothetical protein